MSKRISKISVGTIGNEKCEIALNDILIKLDDAYMNRRVLGRYTVFKDGLKKILIISEVDESFCMFMLNLWRKHNEEQIEAVREKFTEDVYSHLMCCMAGKYRDAKRNISITKGKGR